MSLICGVLKIIQMNLFSKQKQTHSHTQKTNVGMVTKGERRWERDKLGVWEQHIQTIAYKINNKVLLHIAHRTIFNIL